MQRQRTPPSRPPLMMPLLSPPVSPLRPPISPALLRQGARRRAVTRPTARPSSRQIPSTHSALPRQRRRLQWRPTPPAPLAPTASPSAASAARPNEEVSLYVLLLFKQYLLLLTLPFFPLVRRNLDGTGTTLTLTISATVDMDGRDKRDEQNEKISSYIVVLFMQHLPLLTLLLLLFHRHSLGGRG